MEEFVNKYSNTEFELLKKLIDDDKMHNDCLDRPNIYLRYRDIRPYDYNKVDISAGHQYINASWIHIPLTNYFIATQGPTPKTIEDFWIMCSQYNVDKIIMLCKLKEKNVEKCANYWDVNNIRSFIIKKVKEEFIDEDNSIILRVFQFFNIKQNTSKYIHQIHLTCWEDHGTLNNNYFDKIRALIDFIDKNKTSNPVVVHCSAGVGRTGTFISLYNIYHEIMQQIFGGNKEIIEISVFNLVRKIKEQRMHMVENENQYFFLYLFINYLLNTYNK